MVQKVSIKVSPDTTIYRQLSYKFSKKLFHRKKKKKEIDLFFFFFLPTFICLLQNKIYFLFSTFSIFKSKNSSDNGYRKLYCYNKRWFFSDSLHVVFSIRCLEYVQQNLKNAEKFLKFLQFTVQQNLHFLIFFSIFLYLLFLTN